MAGGRPTKLTPALLAKLAECADDQWSIRDAAAAIGIAENTWRAWESSSSDDPLIAEFVTLALRVRDSSAKKIDDLAWGALRFVLEDPEARAGDKVAAAGAALRLRTAHRVELTGKDGGAVEVSLDSARARLDDLLKRSTPTTEA